MDMSEEKTMKCPFRKMTNKVSTTNTITREYYMDCYGEECPFYEKTIGCMRVDTAVWESTHYNPHA